MNKKQSRVISLVILALFICLVGFVNRAQAGGGNTGPDNLMRSLLIQQSFANPNNPNQ